MPRSFRRVDLAFAAVIVALFLIGAASEPLVAPAPAQSPAAKPAPAARPSVGDHAPAPAPAHANP